MVEEEIPLENLGEEEIPMENLGEEEEGEYIPLLPDVPVDDDSVFSLSSITKRLKEIRSFKKSTEYTNPSSEEKNLKEKELDKIKSDLEKEFPLIKLKFLDIDLVKNGEIMISGQLKGGKYTKSHKLKNSKGELVNTEKLPKAIKNSLGPTIEKILDPLENNQKNNNIKINVLKEK